MSDQILNVIIAAAVPGGFSLWVAWLNLRSKTRSDIQSAQGDYYRGLETRIDALQTRVDEMQQKLDTEIEKRRSEQYKNHLLKTALQEYVTFAESVMSWIKAGSVPPPPDPPTTDIRRLLE